MSAPKRIEQIWAYIAVDAAGDEGICAYLPPTGVWTPAIGADHDRVVSLRPIVQEIATASGATVTLYRFGGERTQVEVIRP